MVVEVRSFVKQSDIVAATNMIWANFESLSPSRLLGFVFIAGSPFLTQDTDNEDEFALSGIVQKVCGNPASSSWQYQTLIKGGTVTATATSASIALMQKGRGAPVEGKEKGEVWKFHFIIHVGVY